MIETRGAGIPVTGVRAAWRVYGPKIARRLRALPRSCAGLVLILLVRLLSFVRPIQIFWLPVNRIGALAPETAVYLARREIMPADGAIHLFGLDGFISNHQLARMCRRQMTCVPFVLDALRWNLRLSNPERYVVDWPGFLDEDGALLKTKAPEIFTEDERRRGSEIAARLGIPLDRKLAVFHNRDSHYLSKRPDFSEFDFSYHDYRNFSIETMVPAMQAAVEAGYFVVRIGRDYGEVLPSGLKDIVDITDKDVDDLFDIFIVSKADFLVGTTSGAYTIGLLLRKPLVLTNCVPLMTLCYQKSTELDFILVKKYHSRAQGRYLTASEIHAIGAEQFATGEEFEAAGIDVHSNTPDEITDAVREMMDVLDGKSDWSKEDQRRQDLFFKSAVPDLAKFVRPRYLKFRSRNDQWDRFSAHLDHASAFYRFGRKFLEQNTWLTK
jgi:putative glycosyltransferase (TIGR04372 family)